MDARQECSYDRRGWHLLLVVLLNVLMCLGIDVRYLRYIIWAMTGGHILQWSINIDMTWTPIKYCKNTMFFFPIFVSLTSGFRFPEKKQRFYWDSAGWGIWVAIVHRTICCHNTVQPPHNCNPDFPVQHTQSFSFFTCIRKFWSDEQGNVQNCTLQFGGNKLYINSLKLT